MRPLRTVHAALEAAGALRLLDDPLLETATAEIVAGAVQACTGAVVDLSNTCCLTPLIAFDTGSLQDPQMT